MNNTNYSFNSNNNEKIKNEISNKNRLKKLEKDWNNRFYLEKIPNYDAYNDINYLSYGLNKKKIKFEENEKKALEKGKKTREKMSQERKDKINKISKYQITNRNKENSKDTELYNSYNSNNFNSTNNNRINSTNNWKKTKTERDQIESKEKPIKYKFNPSSTTKSKNNFEENDYKTNSNFNYETMNNNKKKLDP